MKNSLLQLACAAAIGALAMSAQAQYSSPAPATQPASPAASTPSPSTSSQMGTDAKADADYKAAQAKCNTLTGDAKANCLNDAKAARDRAAGPSSDATPPNTEAPAAGNTTKPKQ
jgi:hypothetical protein